MDERKPLLDAKEAVSRERRGGVRGQLAVDHRPAWRRRRAARRRRARRRPGRAPLPRSEAARAAGAQSARPLRARARRRATRSAPSARCPRSRARRGALAGGAGCRRSASWQRVGELDVDVARERLADQRLRRVERQRLRADHDSAGIRDDLGDERLLVALRGRAGSRDQQDRHPLEAARRVVEPAERGCVAPVQVVDGEQQRLAGGEVAGEPEEAVQRREGVVGEDVRVAQRRARRRAARRARRRLRAAPRARRRVRARGSARKAGGRSRTRIRARARRRAH